MIGYQYAPNDHKRNLGADLDSGLGLREIARNTGIPEGTVLARAKREG